MRARALYHRKPIKKDANIILLNYLVASKAMVGLPVNHEFTPCARTRIPISPPRVLNILFHRTAYLQWTSHGLLHPPPRSSPPSLIPPHCFISMFSGHIALFFPRKSTQDYVVAEKPFVKNLTAFTVGMWVQMANDSKTKLSTTVFFSYAIINGSDNNRELFFEMDAHEVWLGIRTIQKR